jgi:hypothetical protein
MLPEPLIVVLLICYATLIVGIVLVALAMPRSYGAWRYPSDRSRTAVKDNAGALDSGFRTTQDQ